jgi:hypothetical protein
MAILSKGQTFASTDTVTSTKLNNLVDNAAFVSGSSGTTDDSSLEVNGSGRLQVKDSGISSAKIAASAVTTVKIGDSQITTAKILDLNVTEGKIADNAITNAKMADNSVNTAEIVNAAVTTVKVADANVTAAKLSGSQTGNAPIYGVRAWVLFDATRNSTGGSDTLNTNRFIIASGNVTSVAKTNTGTFTITFTSALPSADYAYFGNSLDQGSSTEINVYRPSTGAKTTTVFDVVTRRLDGSLRNPAEVSISFLV